MARQKKRSGGKTPPRHEHRNEEPRIDPEAAAQDMNRQGPSPGDPIDEMVIDGATSPWVEASARSAGDPVTEDELKAFDLLGRSSVRDDAIEGVSDEGGPSTTPPRRFRRGARDDTVDADEAPDEGADEEHH